jgi:very-short-patch-repair endonuclease
MNEAMSEAERPTAHDEGHRQAIRRLFEETRRRLVEIGTRNRLVHVNRQSRRSNVLDIVNERSDDVYSILVVNRRTMRFLATGRDKSDDSDTPSLALPPEEAFDAERYTDFHLETRLGPDGLQKRLLKLARDARTAEEEQGINILYLALGFLTWFEDNNSSVKREAPLVLVPVELVRNARTSTYDIRVRDDDIVTNLPLQERLKGDFGIRLPDVEVDETWTPSRYFESVAEVIATRERWSIDPDGMQLGFFSFAKLLMFHDLDPEKWPDNRLEGHELTRSLLYEGFEPEPPMFGKEDNLDEKLPAHAIYHVVDADASQAKVVEEVRSGRNLVVQGPPGTGKSQTITNIIAAAARDGKRVLFVAEKMAALSVVHDRLVKVGLADICLELHSKTANKKVVLGELGRTLNAAHAIPAMPAEPDRLQETRDWLNRIAAALHLPIGGSGESAFDALARQVRFIGQGAPPPTLKADGLASLSREEASRLASVIRDYGTALAQAGPLAEHPYAGTGRCDLQPTDIGRLEKQLLEATAAGSALAVALANASGALGVEVPVTLDTASLLANQLERLANPPELDDALLVRLVELKAKDRLRETLTAGAAWREARDTAAPAFVEAAWTIDAAPLRAPLAAGQSSFFARWGSLYRQASRQLAGLVSGALPKRAAERTDLVDSLLRIAALRSSWREDESWCAGLLGDEWRGERTAFALLRAALDWCDRASAGTLLLDAAKTVALARAPNQLAALIEALETDAAAARGSIPGVVAALQLDVKTAFQADTIETGDLRTIAARFGAMASSSHRYEEWSKLSRLRASMRSDGLEMLAEQMETGGLAGEAAATEFLFARAEAVWKEAVEKSPLIASLREVDRHELVNSFAALEKERLKDSVKFIRAGHLKQVPQGARGAMAVVRGELAKRRAHLPLRKLFTGAAEAIQRIKPVLLMSPISVAQFLPPGTIKFDLLLIDEASQVRPEDALGAIARADQIVVVGDQKQLPPSAFFDRLAGSDDDGEDEEEHDDLQLLDGAARVGALESILTLCEARGLGSRMLEWHYRSRDPSLIRVSNREFYKDGLILPPSPLQNDPAYGLAFTRVAGAYDRSGKRDNRLEGAAIVKRVVEHAAATPSFSLGIVTFSSAQRNLITELLEYERRQDRTLDEFLREGGSEDVFVKNIENVQGDERDVILVSVGYGPTEPGARLTNMNFGPVNGEGGERRLNVLFTRARLRCEVFASFDPGDIDLTKVSKEGPRVLKRFLEFAKTGLMADKVATGADPDTPFEADVADVITALGYKVDHQVGSAGFLIDLGVCHPERPGTYILAVECDGSTYHSALWARERDRLRQSVLEHLGWRFHRVWSTDWFYRRAAEVDRLKAALEAAVKASDAGIVIEGGNDAAPRVSSTPTTIETIFDVPEAPERKMPSYARSQVSVRSHVDPHEADPNLLARLAAQIVEDEGPIHEEEVARRIAAAFGKERAGARILATVQRALKTAYRRSDISLRHEDAFWATSAQLAAPVVRDRSAETGPLCKAAFISMSEITEAVRLAMEDNAGGSDQEITRAASRLFGFKRVGSELQERLQAGLERLKEPD